MGLYEEIRGQSKLDSRRFGKGISCEIIYGEDLVAITSSTLRLYGYHFQEQTGYDPVTSSILAVPLDKLEEFRSLVSDLKTTTQNLIDFTKKKDDINVPEEEKDDLALKLLETSARKEATESGLRKMVILVFAENVPDGKKAGPLPSEYRIKVESVDVGQQVLGEFTRKNFKRG